MAGLEAIASREMKEAPREREKSSAHRSSAVPWPRKHAARQLLLLPTPPPLLLLPLLLLAERWGAHHTLVARGLGDGDPLEVTLAVPEGVVEGRRHRGVAGVTG